MKFKKITSIRKINSKEKVYDIQLEKNHYFSANNIISHNCRLLSDQDKMELASQANSFGAGGSISLGSHRVITVNFVRLALMAKDVDDFCRLVQLATTNCKKILYAHKQMLNDLKSSQMFLKIGWIQLDRMFSTVGILGYIEANEILKEKFNNVNIDFLGTMLDYLNNTLNENNEEYSGCFFNVEQVPAESMSHRLARADKILFGNDKIPFDIYSNQFTPLWNHTSTIWEKMETDGKYLSRITGGGITHINTGEHITSKQAEKLIQFAVESNAEHIAVTGTFCQCIDGHVIIGKRDTCAKCGKPIKSKIARVVGFFTPVEDWNDNKIKYDHERRKEYINGDFDNANI